MPLTRNPTRLIAKVLTLALLVAQLGAELHVYYSHALADPVDHLGAARNCGTCLASSQLQNAVAAPPPALPVRAIAWVTIVPEASPLAVRTESHRAYRSRAPPALA